jgi:two-component system sensor histidine kinase YesM
VKRSSLSKRLMVGLVLLIALQAAFIGTYYYRNTSDRYIESALNTTRTVLLSNVELIDAKLLRLQDQANKMAVSNEIYKLLMLMPDKDMGLYHWSKGYDWSRELKRLVYTYLGDFSFMTDASILMPFMDYSYHGLTRYGYQSFRASSLFRPELDKRYHQYWLATELAGGASSGKLSTTRRRAVEQMPLFRFVKQLNISTVINEAITVMPLSRQRPVLVIDLNPDVYAQTLKEALPTPGSRYLVCDADGRPVAGTETPKYGKALGLPFLSAVNPEPRTCASGSYVMDGKRYLVLSSVSAVNGWVSSVMIPLAELTQSAKNNLYVVLIVVVASTLVMLLLIFFFVSRTMQPVSRIARMVEDIGRTQGAIAQRANLSETDRISMSITAMNRLIGKLMTENSEIQHREQDATILSLEMQINPHFLYNSLNKIYLSLHNAGQHELAESLLPLSSVLRYSIDSKEHVVFLYSDLNQLSTYIAAIKNEREGAFSVYYDIEASMYDSIVPKMMLQPFVENSILHGFKNRTHGCVIHIEGHVEGDTAVYAVEDNGEGIPPDKLYILTDGGAEGHIGCANVNRRIKLLYGDRYGISVTSGKGGTRVEIRLPFILETEPQD